MLQPLSSTSRVMMVRFSSASVTPIELSVLARWTIRPKILGVPGVANVSIWGQRERQLQVQVDPDRLRSQGLTLDEVIETSGNALWASPLTFLEASTPGTGGFIDTAQQRLGIQHLQPITTATDLAEVPIETASGTTVRLGDVADVVEDHQP
jgi:multidrug efflux pump subunit AcrB